MNIFKSSLLFLILLLLCRSNIYAQNNSPEASHLFSEAGLEYKKGNYEKAIKHYESILQKGLTNGTLYYNSGNSYFKYGDMGKAILNYERALKLMPRDSDLHSNYSYALSLQKINEINFNHTFIKRVIQKYADQITLDELTIALFFFILLIGTIYLSMLFFRWPQKTSFFVIAGLFMLLCFHSYVFALKMEESNKLAIVLHDADSKFEPVEKSATHFKLKAGTKIKIIKKESDWFKIERMDGKAGWIKVDIIERI